VWQGGAVLPRLSGWFREAGIYQAFCVWGLLVGERYGLRQWWLRGLLVVAVVATLSTAGLVLLLASAGLYVLFRKRDMHAVVRGILFAGLVGVSVAGLLLAPIVGLESKSVSNPASLGDRLGSAVSGLSDLSRSPLGTGLYGATVPNSAINLIGASREIGAVGLCLVLAAFGAAVIGARDRRYALVCLLDAPLVYITLLASYGSDVIEEGRVLDDRTQSGGKG
jgi:hypothetical protein